MKRSVLSLLLVVFVVPQFASAAPPDPRRVAITDINEVDADFAYQGEYAGYLWQPQSSSNYGGLQVIARGGGNFDGVLYSGGLPGNGWDRQTKTQLAGSMQDGVARFTGDGYVIEADGSQAIVYDTGGTRLGQLGKVERYSTTLGDQAPWNATILFDGSTPENLEGTKVTDDGLLEIGATTKMPVGDFRLHIEFRLPYMPYATGQGRANSGVYIQRRYEVQILDSFGLEGVENECGGLYRQQRPDLNMCFPPLSWQTYDIWFTAARFDSDGKKTANARITVWHNGVAIHDDREVKSKTGAGRPEGPEPMPILFQNHGNPVHFRNMWIVLEDHDEVATVECIQTCTPRRCRLFRFFRRCR